MWQFQKKYCTVRKKTTTSLKLEFCGGDRGSSHRGRGGRTALRDWLGRSCSRTCGAACGGRDHTDCAARKRFPPFPTDKNFPLTSSVTEIRTWCVAFIFPPPPTTIHLIGWRAFQSKKILFKGGKRKMAMWGSLVGRMFYLYISNRPIESVPYSQPPSGCGGILFLITPLPCPTAPFLMRNDGR